MQNTFGSVVLRMTKFKTQVCGGRGKDKHMHLIRNRQKLQTREGESAWGSISPEGQQYFTTGIV